MGTKTSGRNRTVDVANLIDMVEIMTKSAPSISMDQFSTNLQERHIDHHFGENKTNIWVPGSRYELLRLPLEYNEALDPNEEKVLLRKKGIYIGSYLVKPHSLRGANCYDYVCSDGGYDIDNLESNSRRDIRRGLRSFSVRLCDLGEIVEFGYDAVRDTLIRHGYSVLRYSEYAKSMASQKDQHNLDYWGAWENGRLAAWMRITKIDDWAMIDVARSCTEDLKLCPNNALLYLVTYYNLRVQGKRYITYGLSSTQVGVNELSMHRFKTKMGYDPVPLTREFIMNPSLRAFLSMKATSKVLAYSAGAFARSAAVRKAAGLSRLISGIDRTPLWGQDIG